MRSARRIDRSAAVSRRRSGDQRGRGLGGRGGSLGAADGGGAQQEEAERERTEGREAHPGTIPRRPRPGHGLDAEGRKRLIEALTHLPLVYRTPVLLRDIQGLSTEEASAVLRVKPQTLKSRLHRGRLILRQHLGDFADGIAMHDREAA